MKAVNSLAVATAVFGSIPGIALAGADSARAVPAASTCAGMLESACRGLSYIDVSSDDDRGRGAAVTTTPGSGGASEYSVLDPMPVFRWATRGEWRRHRSAAPVESGTVPLT